MFCNRCKKTVKTKWKESKDIYFKVEICELCKKSKGLTKEFKHYQSKS